jgi:hypothetical protein
MIVFCLVADNMQENKNNGEIYLSFILFRFI